MTKISKEKEFVYKPEPVTYSIRELEDFGEYLKPFREEVTLSNGEVIKVLRLKEVGVSLGVYTKKVKAYEPTEWKPEPYSITEYFVPLGKVSEYHEFYNKYEQWQRMMDRREYAENQSLKQWDTSEIASKFKIG